MKTYVTYSRKSDHYEVKIGNIRKTVPYDMFVNFLRKHDRGETSIAGLLYVEESELTYVLKA